MTVKPFMNAILLSLALAASGLQAAEQATAKAVEPVAGIDPEKKALIDTLLGQTGQSAKEMGKQFSDLFIQQMTMMLKQSRPDMDPRAFDILREEVTAVIDEELAGNGAFTAMMYPIYDRHFTADEIRAMIEFNETPLGKKLIRVMPQVSQEGMAAGQSWGQSLGPIIQTRLMTRFKEEGIM